MLVSRAQALLSVSSAESTKICGRARFRPACLQHLINRAAIKGCGYMWSGQVSAECSFCRIAFLFAQSGEEKPLSSSGEVPVAPTALCPWPGAGPLQGRGSSKHCWVLQMCLSFRIKTTKLWRPHGPMSHTPPPKVQS